ncbi:MAG TPA: NAD(P)/FAD-dependent oxidoreductase [Solirubrobacteraceae bacterium]|nr:NAD(P)/FAD-dependent oxidoreductase [Solirubrobacteraceae bacterium]
MPRAEIAGGGFAGLTVATLLARAGWDTTVHERAPAIREIGAGLFITHNGLVAIERLGLLDELAPHGAQLTHAVALDRDGRTLTDVELTGCGRTWLFPRERLIDALHAAAERAGARIVTSSEIVSATPDALRLGDGRTVRADLVIGADGYRSTVRRTLGLQRTAHDLGTVSLRFLLPSRELCGDDVTRQYWSGPRRVAVTACSPTQTYVYFACPHGDESAWSGPSYLDTWRDSFPVLMPLFDELRTHEPYVGRYGLVRCRAWSSGNAALLGDAAHALAPTLGQGTNLAMVNACSLVEFVTKDRGPIAERLARWERRTRPVTDASQRWSSLIDWTTRYWPIAIESWRSPAISWLSGRGRGRFDIRAGSYVAPVELAAPVAGA